MEQMNSQSHSVAVTTTESLLSQAERELQAAQAAESEIFRAKQEAERQYQAFVHVPPDDADRDLARKHLAYVMQKASEAHAAVQEKTRALEAARQQVNALRGQINHQAGVVANWRTELDKVERSLRAVRSTLEAHEGTLAGLKQRLTALTGEAA